MDTRKQNLLHIRPEIPSAIVNENMSSGERFQNSTLRPIIKLQNDLFVATFRNYINKHKGAFYNLSLEKKLKYIENTIQRDIKYRNSLKGMVIGHFTTQEYLVYIENSSSLNKRMMNMVIERLKDQVLLLENQKVA